MRNGYFVLTKGRNVIKVFSNDKDMSPSQYGLELLDNVFNVQSVSDVDTLLDLKEEDSFDFTKDDFIKNKENRSNHFEDYNYIYDLKNNTLKLYYSGELLYSISLNEVDLYKFIFKNDDVLYKVFSFNREKRTMENDFVKEIKKFLKSNSSVDELKKQIDSFDYKLFINSAKIEDCWRNSYKRVIQDMDYNDIMTFIIYKEFGKYSISIQFPYIRKSIDRGFSSERKAEKRLSEIVSSNEDDILNLYNIFKLYNDSYSKISKEWKQNNNDYEYISSKCREYIDIFDNNISKYMCENKCFNITDSIKQEMIRELYSLNRSLYECN